MAGNNAHRISSLGKVGVDRGASAAACVSFSFRDCRAEGDTDITPIENTAMIGSRNLFQQPEQRPQPMAGVLRCSHPQILPRFARGAATLPASAPISSCCGRNGPPSPASTRTSRAFPRDIRMEGNGPIAAEASSTSRRTCREGRGSRYGRTRHSSNRRNFWPRGSAPQLPSLVCGKTTATGHQDRASIPRQSRGKLVRVARRERRPMRDTWSI